MEMATQPLPLAPLWGAGHLRDFVAGLQREESICRRVLDVVYAQIKNLPTMTDPDGIASMSAQKRDLVEQLDALYADLAQLKQQWPSVRRHLPSDVAARVQQRVSDLDTLVKELVDAEAKSCNLLRHKLSGNRELINTLTKRGLGRMQTLQPVGDEA